MRLGERCDEIVRLIDETLADLGIDPVDALSTGTTSPGSAPVATVTPLPPTRGSAAGPGRRDPEARPRPGRAASGF